VIGGDRGACEHCRRRRRSCAGSSIIIGLQMSGNVKGEEDDEARSELTAAGAQKNKAGSGRQSASSGYGL